MKSNKITSFGKLALQIFDNQFPKWNSIKFIDQPDDIKDIFINYNEDCKLFKKNYSII